VENLLYHPVSWGRDLWGTNMGICLKVKQRRIRFTYASLVIKVKTPGLGAEIETEKFQSSSSSEKYLMNREILFR
jgi:hypothetical protein